MGELLIWWLAAEALGIVALPLAAVLGANLPDRGWGLARPLGLLVLGWLVWFPLSVISALPYSRGWIAGTFVALALANAALLRAADVRAALHRLLAREWGYLLASEAVFAGAFALMGWERSFTPAVVDQEKFMDVAFLSSIWRAPHLPPPDPWLSGYPINYYYFGHFLMATMAKLLGTTPASAFNTSIALVFALTASAVFAIAANLVAAARRQPARALGRAAPFGVASALLVLVLGNLNGAQIWWKGAAALVSQHQLSSPWAWWTHPMLWLQYDWWSPSRVIAAPSYTINEFPAFSFILADLHAHLLALPFAGLALGVALNLLLARGEGLRAFGLRWAGVLALFLAALALGALYAINGWDLPTYLGFTMLALAAQQWLAHGRRWSGLFVLDFASAGIMLAALSVFLYIPFYRGFTSPAQGIGLVPVSRRSSIGEELAIYGLPAFLVGSLLVVRLSAWAGAQWGYHERHEGHGGGALGGLAPGAVLVAACLALLLLWTALTPGARNWPLVWSVLFLAASAALVLRRLAPHAGDSAEPDFADRAEVFVYCLVGTAAALVATSEVIYLRDVFDGGTAFRMNTVFKLYYQAWLLLGVAGGPALAALLQVCRVPLARVFRVPVSRHASGRAPTSPAHTGLGGATIVTPVALSTAGSAPGAAAPKLAEAVDQLAFSYTDIRDAATDSADPSVEADTPLGARSDHGGRGIAPAGSLLAAFSPIRASTLRWAAAGGTLLWGAALVALVGAALVYPVQASAARTDDFALPHSLDGTAFMDDSVNHPLNVGDAAAIAWLDDPAHVSGNPVILEASGGEYTDYERISAFTGLPTVLGWAGHEWQWRVNWLLQPVHVGLLDRRQADIDQIYTNRDPRVVLALLARYHIRYVYVGAAERAKYPGTDLERFASFLQVIYRHAGVTIYQVGR
jgi:YYY domain-containing protein